MAHWLLATATLLLYLTIRGSYSAVTTSCDAVFRTCEQQYKDQTANILQQNSTNSSDALCQLAVQTLLCLSTCPPSSPVSSEGLFRLNVIQDQNRYCGYVPAPTTPPPPFLPAVPVISPCVPSGLVLANATQPADLAQPNIQSSVTNANCQRGSSKPLLHCSAFGYSHFRAFGASNIQTCLLPGSWFLLKHELLTVEISAVADMDIEVPYTKILKINITLFDHTCFSQRSYIATANKSLPQSFSDGSIAAGILQLSDLMTVAITVPWMNTTIIVRSDQGLLAVALQAPIDLLTQSQGICLEGCSPNTQLTLSPYINQWVNSCLAASNSALFSCVLYSNMFNTFLDISNDSYILACQFELLITANNNTLRFLRAVAYDATLLPDTEHLSLPGKISLYTYLINAGGTSSSSSANTDPTNTVGLTPTSPASRIGGTVLTSSFILHPPHFCLLFVVLATLLSLLSR